MSKYYDNDRHTLTWIIIPWFFFFQDTLTWRCGFLEFLFITIFFLYSNNAIVLVKDELNFHTCVDARVLKSQNDVIVSASPKSNLRTLALHHVRVCDTRLTITVSLTKHTRHRPYSGSPRIETRTRKEIDFLGSRATLKISHVVFFLRALFAYIFVILKTRIFAKEFFVASTIRAIVDNYSLCFYLYKLRATKFK